jgi:hypothetical protein
MDFFREFGDLRLQWSRDVKGRVLSRGLDLSGAYPESPLLPKVANLQLRVGTLTPIAQETDSLFTLVMSPSGEVFAYLDEEGRGDLIWGPWPGAVKSVDDIVNAAEYPTFDMTSRAVRVRRHDCG